MWIHYVENPHFQNSKDFQVLKAAPPSCANASALRIVTPLLTDSAHAYSQTSVLYICADKSIVRRLIIFIMLDNP